MHRENSGNMKSALIFASALAGMCGSALAENDWPIIGMFTQPSSSLHKECGGDWYVDCFCSNLTQ